ncbi:MAG: glycosyltransferase [Acidimicrobiales bacterium]
MVEQPAVRIGIVSWNTAGLLRRCLDALPAAVGHHRSQVVVVDNASTDDSVAAARSFPHVRVIANPTNVGYARAMNQALDGTGAPVLIALNPDTEPPPGSLATLVDRLLADDGLGLIAPRLVNENQTHQHSAYRFPSPMVAAAVCFLPPRLHRGAIGRRLWLEGSGAPRRSTDVDWVVGAVHVLRASALRRKQPYDERWFMYVEDLELCWWLAQHGWRRRIETDVLVPHVGNAAGAQAWGADRGRRWLEATYDWYGRDRGLGARRVLAAINTTGAALHVVGLSIGARVGHPGRADERRNRASALVRSLPGHLRAARWS